MVRLVTLIVVVGGLLSGIASAADWPNFMGPTHNGIAPDTDLNKDWAAKPPKELWRVALTDNGYPGPSVADGKVFIIDHQGAEDIVRALKLETGEELWRYAYADLDTHNFGYAEATPTYFEGMVYTASRLGRINCLNAADGKLVWSRTMQQDFGGRTPGWLYAESVLVDDDKVVICTGAADGNVVALNRTTGELIWKGGNGEMPGYATAIAATILDKKQYLVCTGSSVIGVNPDDGKVLWQAPWQNQAQVNASQPAVVANSIFITSGYGIGCGLFDITPDGAKERWRNHEISAHFSCPVLYNGRIYSNSDPGNLVCMMPGTGAVAWKQKGFEKGGLIAVDGVILALDGAAGDLVMVKADPKEYQELGRIKPLGGQSWTAPVLADGRLLVRNTQTMVCLDLR